MLAESDILKLIEAGENSYIEFKEDSVKNKSLAEEIVAFSNHEGGCLILGVDDNKEITGLTRDDNEERIMNLCEDLDLSPFYPAYYEVTVNDIRVAVMELGAGINKPYCIPKGQEKKFNADEIYLRQGSKTRKLRGRDELQRLFQASAHVHYEVIPVSYATEKDMDLEMAKNFVEKNIKHITTIRRDPEVALKNLDLIVETERGYQPSVAGMLLFGNGDIKKFLPQAGITCVKVAGNAKTDPKTDHKFFTHDLFRNFEDAWGFLRNYNSRAYRIVDNKRIDKYDYPNEVFRELLANACIHRDYTISGSEIFVWFFDNRVEIISPGRLPNTISVEKIKGGAKYHRNPILAQFFAYEGIVEMLGQGILMADAWLRENGNPEVRIEERDEEVVVTVFKE